MLLTAVQNMMKKLDLTADEAVGLLGIPKAEQEKLLEALKNA